ncbi:MAG: DUF7670 domain-containing protein [Nanobdellota archaeon]
MKRKISKFVYWTPRILSILFLLFLAMFSLDIFGNGYTFWQIVVGLIMHNIPVFILTIVLIIAWRHELVGAIAFTVAGVLYIVQLLITVIRNMDNPQPMPWSVLAWSLIIAGPIILCGVLFYICWRRKRKNNRKKVKKKR